MSMRLILIAGALTLAVGCGGNSSPSNPTPTPPPTPTTVSIVQGARTMTTTAYNPNPVTISRGTTVMWVNNDTITHTSTSTTGAWSSGNMAPGGNFSYTFQSAGSFPYNCTIHPNMVGTVTVQ